MRYLMLLIGVSACLGFAAPPSVDQCSDRSQMAVKALLLEDLKGASDEPYQFLRNRIPDSNRLIVVGENHLLDIPYQWFVEVFLEKGDFIFLEFDASKQRAIDMFLSDRMPYDEFIREHVPVGSWKGVFKAAKRIGAGVLAINSRGDLASRNAYMQKKISDNLVEGRRAVFFTGYKHAMDLSRGSRRYEGVPSLLLSSRKLRPEEIHIVAIRFKNTHSISSTGDAGRQLWSISLTNFGGRAFSYDDLRVVREQDQVCYHFKHPHIETDELILPLPAPREK